jgi:hypothetical protein
MVGTGGFEPPTPCTPSKCATRLRHVPTAKGLTEFYQTAKKMGDPSIVNGQRALPFCTAYPASYLPCRPEAR